MRVRARKDANHAEIVKVIRDMGAQVIDMSNLGGGIPDLLVAWKKKYCLVEIKDGAKPPSKQALTEDEKIFHEKWGGELKIVNSVDSAIKLVNELRKP